MGDQGHHILDSILKNDGNLEAILSGREGVLRTRDLELAAAAILRPETGFSDDRANDSAQYDTQFSRSERSSWTSSPQPDYVTTAAVFPRSDAARRHGMYPVEHLDKRGFEVRASDSDAQRHYPPDSRDATVGTSRTESDASRSYVRAELHAIHVSHGGLLSGSPALNYQGPFPTYMPEADGTSGSHFAPVGAAGHASGRVESEASAQSLPSYQWESRENTEHFGRDGYRDPRQHVPSDQRVFSSSTLADGRLGGAAQRLDVAIATRADASVSKSPHVAHSPQLASRSPQINRSPLLRAAAVPEVHGSSPHPHPSHSLAAATQSVTASAQGSPRSISDVDSSHPVATHEAAGTSPRGDGNGVSGSGASVTVSALPPDGANLSQAASAEAVTGGAPSGLGLVTTPPEHGSVSAGQSPDRIHCQTPYGQFLIDQDIVMWTRELGIVAFRDGRSEKIPESVVSTRLDLRHIRCHYCVNGPNVEQKRSKWLTKCRRVACGGWYCQTHYPKYSAVEGITQPSMDNVILQELMAGKHTPFVCLADFGQCCCSPSNNRCENVKEKACATFQQKSHKCEKVRHRVYNATKRRQKRDDEYAVPAAGDGAPGASSPAMSVPGFTFLAPPFAQNSDLAIIPDVFAFAAKQMTEREASVTPASTAPFPAPSADTGSTSMRDDVSTTSNPPESAAPVAGDTSLRRKSPPAAARCSPPVASRASPTSSSDAASPALRARSVVGGSPVGSLTPFPVQSGRAVAQHPRGSRPSQTPPPSSPLVPQGRASFGPPEWATARLHPATTSATTSGSPRGSASFPPPRSPALAVRSSDAAAPATLSGPNAGRGSVPSEGGVEATTHLTRLVRTDGSAATVSAPVARSHAETSPAHVARSSPVACPGGEGLLMADKPDGETRGVKRPHSGGESVAKRPRGDNSV